MAATGKKQPHKTSLQKNAVKDVESVNTKLKQGKSIPDFVKWIVFVFALLLYADTLDLNYTLDDSLMITDNTFTKKGVGGIKEIFTNDAFVGFLGKNNLLPGGRYRPFSQVMFAVEKEIFGFNPFVGHLINILLYAFTCMLLFVILQKLFKNFKTNQWYLSIAFVAAMLFTAHPLHTEVVANIKGRDEILCLLFSLLTVYFTLRYTEKQKISFLIINLIMFFFAILSKENALPFLAIIPLMLYVFKNEKLKIYLLTLMPLVIAVAAYFILRVSMIGIRAKGGNFHELLNDPFLDATFMQKYATILLTWLKYLWLLIFPHPLTHDYYPKQIPVVGFSDFRALLSLLICSGLLVFAFMKIKNRNIIAFAILFFFLSFSIVSNLVFNIGTFMNERFMFTALLGFVIVVAYFLTVVMKKKIKNPQTFRTTALIILILVLSAYSLKTVSRNRVWMDDLTLFTTDVKVSANSTKCNTSAGGKLIEKADSTDNEAQKNNYLRQAQKYLKKALEIYPQNSNALLLLGNADFKLGEYFASRECYRKCLALNPGNKLALNNLRNVAIMTNKDEIFEEARITYKMLLNYKPEDAENYFGLGLAYRGLNKFDSAIISLEKSLELKPDYVDALSKMGEIYGQNLNRIDRAEDCFLKAIKIKPNDESSLENLGIVYGIKGDYKRSLSFFQQALELKPDKYELYLNIAETYRIMGNQSMSADFMSKAQKYKPAGK